ncbi:MAG TPA: hypothetical protein VLV78_21560 [Thermoanaerobaculia bacterium]|nr:hypothetical protein [Thermoanaerobaculia bacterium]
MKRAALLLLIFLVSFCAGGRGDVDNASIAGHGAISIEIVPNPVVATRVNGETYDFPFDVVVRETGGRPVDVTSVSATVFAFGGIQIATETYDAARINRMGYSTRVPANGQLRYRFDPRRDVTDSRLFQGVSADIRAEARDDTGTPTVATTRVSVTRA